MTAETPRPEGKPPQQLVSTENIISRNLFDPERGASMARASEASSLALQKIRSMVLLGTAILGPNRFAVMSQPADARTSRPQAQGQTQEQLRFKLGDSVEGYQLSEITEQKVVFTKGPSRVEVALDYFRKFEEVEPRPAAPGQVRPAGPAPRPMVPRVVPNIPRRERLPVPPTP